MLYLTCLVLYLKIIHINKGPFGSTEKEGRGGEVRGEIFKEGRRGKT
jgi:hypothetical protein